MPAKNNRKKNSRDPFFDDGPTKRRRVAADEDQDAEIESDSDFDEDGFVPSKGEGEQESEEETTAEARKRVAEEYLRKFKDSARREKEQRDEDDDGSDDDDEDEDGARDSLSTKMIKEQQEESGRIRKAIASRVKLDGDGGFENLVKHKQCVTAVALSEDDSKGFSASKDGSIVQWDVESGKCERYKWPIDSVLKSHGLKDPQGSATKQSRQILTLAASSDGRYLATGGLDRHIHIWDTRTREHLQAFPGHRGPVSSLAFREGSTELFSGSFDRTIKIWNVEDRTYMNTLFGHQSEVLSIDCLRKERVLSAGRDRSMQLFKVHEESRLVFRAPASSLECCCFVNNEEFLSGSDDGSIELWGAVRKKPIHILRNAHALLTDSKKSDQKDSEILPNGNLENGHHHPENHHCSSVHSWVSAVTVCRNSDLAASGAGNGFVRLWTIENETKDIKPLHNVPLVGFVNSLAFAKSAKFLVAGVGQEPRLGRWGRIREARNGVSILPLKLSS